MVATERRSRPRSWEGITAFPEAEFGFAVLSLVREPCLEISNFGP